MKYLGYPITCMSSIKNITTYKSTAYFGEIYCYGINKEVEFISKQTWCVIVFQSAHENSPGKLGLRMLLQISDWRICASSLQATAK